MNVFFLVNQWQLVAAAITTVLLCTAVCVAVSLTALKLQYDKHPVTLLIKAEVLPILKCSIQQQHKEPEIT